MVAGIDNRPGDVLAPEEQQTDTEIADHLAMTIGNIRASRQYQYCISQYNALVDAAVLTIYGNHMEKTTLYLDAEAYRRLKQLARDRGMKPAAMLREAVAEYTARHAPRRKPRSIGSFKSGRRDLGQRAEQLLAGLGEDK
jgi:hypothetical protein